MPFAQFLAGQTRQLYPQFADQITYDKTPGGAEDQCDGHPLHQQEGEGGAADSADQIIEEEHAPAHPLFYGRPEYEQHQHVEREMQDARVQKQVGDERPRPLQRMQRHEPQRLQEARVDQQRLLDKEDEQIGDE